MSAHPSIRMGELMVVRDDGALRTLLGSCVGIALYDRRSKVGGLAHAVLPWSPGEDAEPGRFVDTATDALLERMAALAGRRIQPTARIAGGADMFRTNAPRTIGQQNIEASEQVLGRLGIPIVGRHCGGTQGRRMIFDTGNGDITIEMVGQPPVELRDKDTLGSAAS
ncbi:MAG: chemotaxis protein CheD [Planctomycetota bacterium]